MIANEINVDPGHLHVSNRYISKAPVEGFETTFGIARYDGIEQFRINVDFSKTSVDDYFASIFRSDVTRYIYNLTYKTVAGFRLTSDLVLVGSNPNENAVFTVAPGIDSIEPASIKGGTWTFNDPLKPIVIVRENFDVR